MWLNQTVQNNKTSTLSVTNSKIDCAKECPCGVPAIPVPDQWLEVMVTGGFKVWHIIFIIIAFIVTMIVIYCCFHRCRIPRTKQEIEADLMRSNLGNKFRDYLQELPNEPFTFTEALKKVQEIEAKLEQDDAELSRELGARKRMGWIKLKGKEKEANNKDSKVELDNETIDANNKQQQQQQDKVEPDRSGTQLAETIPGATEPSLNQQSAEKSANGQLKPPNLVAPSEMTSTDSNNEPKKGGKQQQQLASKAAEPDVLANAEETKPPSKTTTTKKRRQKPNLSRTKLAKERPLLVESSDNLERSAPEKGSSHLELPDPASRRAAPVRGHRKKLKSEKDLVIETKGEPKDC